MKRTRGAALLLLLLLTGCGAPAPASVDFFAMNTVMSAQVLGENGAALCAKVEAKVNELEGLLSRTRETSDIYRLNHAGGAPVQLAAQTQQALGAAQQFAAKTAGNYDPTVAPLTDLWGIGTDAARVPAPAEIDAARRLIGYQSLALAADGSGAARLQNGAQLDLGGIAKGIAADEAAAILRAEQASGLLALGGNIYAAGTNGGAPWKVGIADPDSPQNYVATVSISDLSVVTTGDYERFFEQNGKRYHHVFDPKTGYPAASALRSVTIIGEASTACDAYSTAVFVMGPAKGLEFCNQNGIAAVFITADKRVFASDAVEPLCALEVTDARYTYEK